mmetsp:Transcript_38959/g.107490  ORF Transcript_38959/g.107490 Transcript_38959/m.107490 type:complete len:248 (+) Transcript_38959:352-1095(+)
MHHAHRGAADPRAPRWRAHAVPRHAGVCVRRLRRGRRRWPGALHPRPAPRLDRRDSLGPRPLLLHRAPRARDPRVHPDGQVPRGADGRVDRRARRRRPRAGPRHPDPRALRCALPVGDRPDRRQRPPLLTVRLRPGARRAALLPARRRGAAPLQAQARRRGLRAGRPAVRCLPGPGAPLWQLERLSDKQLAARPPCPKGSRLRRSGERAISHVPQRPFLTVNAFLATLSCAHMYNMYGCSACCAGYS